jgi:hypothetical protein
MNQIEKFGIDIHISQRLQPPPLVTLRFCFIPSATIISMDSIKILLGATPSGSWLTPYMDKAVYNIVKYVGGKISHCPAMAMDLAGRDRRAATAESSEPARQPATNR